MELFVLNITKDKAWLPRPKMVLALLIIVAVVVYATIHLDPYIGLLMLPFFALGCGRGKHPAVLLALSALPALLLFVASRIKFALTGLPLVTYDQHFLRQNVLMLVYNDWRIAGAVVVTLALVALYFKHLLTGRHVFTRFEKGAVGALGITAIGCVLGLRGWNQTIDSWESQMATPTIQTFVASASMPGAQLHLTAGAQAATGGALDGARANAASTPLISPAGGLPDIFIVLQESTFHPAVVKPGFTPHALFADAGLKNTAGHTGPLHVHTFAGATWKSEFSVTTQMRPQEFGNDGLYVFYQLKGRIKESIFTRLKALGYRTMVFYPVPGHFINARDFYTSIGVDEFYDPESLEISKGWDWKIPDSKLYDAMLKKIGESDTPVVAMMLTINQHGPHEGPDPIADYVTRFEQSDQAYGDFLTALGQRSRKSGVITFGDHQPDFMANLHDRALWYSTAYDIRCVNFSCADRGVTLRHDKQLDIVMLAPRALEAFGFGLDGFSTLENKLFRDCDYDLSLCSDAARLGVNTAFTKFFD